MLLMSCFMRIERKRCKEKKLYVVEFDDVYG